MPAKRPKLFQARLGLLVLFFVAWSCLIVFRLVDLQIVRYPEMRERARRQQTRMFEISPKRGTIYDRRDRELAVSIKVESVFAVPHKIADKSRTATLLARTLGLDPDRVRRRLEGARSFGWIKRKVDYPHVQKVRELDLPGIYFETENKRFYPKRELAAHVLGYVGMDNEGLAGLEHLYERDVRGTPGRILLHTDARKRYFSSVERPPTAGADLVLTLDESIQYLVEQELQAQVEKSRARGGAAIVMNPSTGAILAMANVPTFNPNHYGRYSESAWRNQAILNIYEPGSTFKVFTAAAALEEGLTTPEEQIHCMNGGIVIGKHRIRDHKPFGWLSVREVIARSSNVGVIQLGFRIGKQRLERYLRHYGFGRPTQVDLPGEARGLLRPASDWHTVDLGTISMGQGIGVTPLQMITAAGMIANGGEWIPPRVVERVRSDRISRSPSLSQAGGRRVLRKETAETIKEMMSLVVAEGTGRRARLRGFSAAGKTGTAQKVDERGRYSHTQFIASFVGFAPVENPALSIVVLIDEPRGLYYGGQVAAPVFQKIAEKTLNYLSVPPDQPQQEWRDDTRVAELRAEENPSEEPLMDAVAWTPASLNGRQALSLSAATVNARQESDLGGYEDVAIGGLTMVAVPNLMGKSLRAVMAEGNRARLQVEAKGAGLVIQQSPAPDSKVAPGSTVRVQLNRNL
ncbi:MAG: penicillin-binding protein [Acidobacteria bacterium]|nr:penicillin-binding protein [Acidobacteriota bacterium]